MNLPDVIRSQYLASLEMLKQTIAKCPESIWDREEDKEKFWRIAYHALFYTHFYLQDSEQAFTPWYKHRQGYPFLGEAPWTPDAESQVYEPYEKDSTLEYLAFCQQQVVERVPHINLEAASGFDWLPFDKLELQLYTIRHIQQHTGELMERLGSGAEVEISWVGTKRS
jgi:hypothetical protein